MGEKYQFFGDICGKSDSIFGYKDEKSKVFNESVVKVHLVLQMGEINPNKVDVSLNFMQTVYNHI